MERRETLPASSCPPLRTGRSVPTGDREPALAGRAAPVDLASACPGFTSAGSGLSCLRLAPEGAGLPWIWGRGRPSREGPRTLPPGRGPEAAAGLAGPERGRGKGR